MKRLGAVYEHVSDTDNLWAAWRDFRRGKSGRPMVRRFGTEATEHIRSLHEELARESYAPGPYRLFLIAEPKRRLISCAPIRDRLVHHALHRVLAPRLDRGLVDHCYACLPGRGVQRAVLRMQRAMRRHRFVLLLDVRAYFASIDPAIVMDLLRRRVKDSRSLQLCERILAGGTGLYDSASLRDWLAMSSSWPPRGVGLPIGNLTSQFFANHYLSGLDHALRRELRLPHAQRYMDDIALFAEDRGSLVRAREFVVDWLWRERRLRLKHPCKEPRQTSRPLIYLGRRVGRERIELTDRALRRMGQRIGAALLHADDRKIERTLASYRGSMGLGPWSPVIQHERPDLSGN